MLTKVVRLLSSNLKSRLVALMLLGFAPALGLEVYNAIQDFKLEEATVEENALRLTRLMLANHKQTVDGAEEFLMAISRLPVMYERGGPECKTILTRLVQTFPRYTTFGLVEPDGSLVCSANPVKLRANISSFRFFQDAINKRTLSLGSYEVDRSTGKPTVLMAMPILDANNNLHAVIVACFDLSHLTALSAGVELPKGSLLVAFARDGLIFARSPNSRGYVGKRWPNMPLADRIVQSNLDEGTTQAPGLDGVDRLYTYNTIHETTDQKVYLALGIPIETLHADARSQFYDTLLTLAVIYLIVAVIVWIGADALVIRKMKSLINAALQMRNGNLSARTGLKDSRDEVGQLARAFDDMAGNIQDRVHEMAKLKEMNDSLQNCLTRDEIVAVACQFMEQLFPKHPGALYLADSEDQLELQTNWHSPPSEKELAFSDCWALRRGKSYCVTTTNLAPRCHHVSDPPPASYVCAPLLTHGEILGLLHVENNEGTPHEKDACPSLPLVEAMAEHVAVTLASLKLREALRAQAIRDGLTGLFNRRYLEEAMVREIRRADRSKLPFSIIMIDIDHFKRFNDTFGHAAGDALLRECGKLFQHEMRGDDLVCRYGGEEFTAILPGTPLENAQAVAEKLRESIQNLTVQAQERLVGNVTISLGVASYPNHGLSGDKLLHVADVALLQAKQGRNRVVVFSASTIDSAPYSQ